MTYSRYAPDTQNRQYALMQKIMMLAKPWCDYTGGSESGLRAWALDVGEWERASRTALADAVKYTVMMNMAPILLGNSLQLGACANSTALRAALLQWCYSSRNFGANPTASSGNGTSAGDDRMHVDCLVTLNSVSSIRRRAGAEYLFLDSGAQLHPCPITYPGQKIPLPDPGIHTASGARLQHDGGRLVTHKLPEGRTIRVLFHACRSAHCRVGDAVAGLNRLGHRQLNKKGARWFRLWERCDKIVAAPIQKGSDNPIFSKRVQNRTLASGLTKCVRSCLQGSGIRFLVL